MSVAEVFISQIGNAPEEVVRETYAFFQELQRQKGAQPAARVQPRIPAPDFESRLKSIYAGRVVASSQTILDEMREDRF